MRAISCQTLTLKLSAEKRETKKKTLCYLFFADLFLLLIGFVGRAFERFPQQSRLFSLGNEEKENGSAIVLRNYVLNSTLTQPTQQIDFETATGMRTIKYVSA